MDITKAKSVNLPSQSVKDVAYSFLSIWELEVVVLGRLMKDRVDEEKGLLRYWNRVP
jgi:hypothetical protein